MLKPTKEAFLKHDLYKLILDGLYDKAWPLEKIPEVKSRKMASAGQRFVYCETDRRDAAHGWYADDGTGMYRAGCCGFGQMRQDWADENLTEPKPLEKQKWR